MHFLRGQTNFFFFIFSVLALKQCCWSVFLKNQKRASLGVQNSSFLNSNFKFVFLRLFFDVKGSFMPIFTKIVNLGPLEFFENVNFEARAPERAKILDLDF